MYTSTTSAPLDRLTDCRRIMETGNDSYRFGRHAAHARMEIRDARLPKH
ncbi:hypothetical protein [Thiomonas sp.]|nr:hypothetical protein [Thiomonas sp.]MDE2279618.1 hypothetical protein [Xanthomonadaceae bacterium]